MSKVRTHWYDAGTELIITLPHAVFAVTRKEIRRLLDPYVVGLPPEDGSSLDEVANLDISLSPIDGENASGLYCRGVLFRVENEDAKELICQLYLRLLGK